MANTPAAHPEKQVNVGDHYGTDVAVYDDKQVDIADSEQRKEDFVIERHHHDVEILNQDWEGKPTDEELETLRRVPGALPATAYLLCAVEFCERASYYGCALIWTNYINRPLPKGGNGYGAVPPGSQITQGALGLGEKVANATGQSFNLIAYCLPLLVGYLADTRFGRYPMIFWGIMLCGLGHVLIIAGGAKALLEDGTAKIPFFIGVFILAIGAGTYRSLHLTNFL